MSCCWSQSLLLHNSQTPSKYTWNIHISAHIKYLFASLLIQRFFKMYYLILIPLSWLKNCSLLSQHELWQLPRGRPASTVSEGYQMGIYAGNTFTVFQTHFAFSNFLQKHSLFLHILWNLTLPRITSNEASLNITNYKWYIDKLG